MSRGLEPIVVRRAVGLLVADRPDQLRVAARAWLKNGTGAIEFALTTRAALGAIEGFCAGAPAVVCVGTRTIAHVRGCSGWHCW